MNNFSIIDNQANPMDIRPIAFDVAHHFDRVKSVKKNAQVVVICGEDHGNAFEVNTYVHIIAALLRKKHKAVCVSETPEDAFQAMAHGLFHTVISSEDAKKTDEKGHYFLKSMIAQSPFDFNPAETSEAQAYRFLLDNDISFIPADLSLEDVQQSLVQALPNFEDLLSTLAGKGKSTLELDVNSPELIQIFNALEDVAESPSAMTARNEHMAEHAKSYESVVMNVGKAHVLELASIFNRMGIYTISILPLSKHETELDILGKNRPEGSVFIVKGHDQTVKMGNLKSNEEEDKFIQSLFRASGNLVPFKPIHNRDVLRYARDVAQTFTQQNVKPRKPLTFLGNKI